MEQGIKMLEELGWEIKEKPPFNDICQLENEYNEFIIISVKKGIAKGDNYCLCEYITPQELKACTMILEAMKGEKYEIF